MKIGTRTLPPAKFIPTVREKKFVNTMKPEKEWDKLDKLAYEFLHCCLTRENRYCL